MAGPSKRPRLDTAVPNDTVDDSLRDVRNFIDELPDELASDAFSSQIRFSDLSQAVATQNHQPSQLVSHSAAMPAQLQQQPPSDHESKRRMIQQQLVLLLHAHKCQRRRMINGVAPQPCQVPHCQTMIDVLKHLVDCQLGMACTVSHCVSSRQIINHWKYCSRSDCVVCLPLRNSSDRPGAVSSINTQTTGAAVHQSFHRHQEQPTMVHVDLARVYDALGLPPPCQQQTVTNMLQEAPSASSSALPLAGPSVGANHLDMSMSATTSLSSDMGALQQHDPTMTQMILGIQRYLELDTLGALSGNVFTGEAPNHTVEDWRQSVTRDVRGHLVCKLVQVIYVSAGSVSSYDERFLIVQYAQKVERKKYELANSREEYYHLLAERFYKIQVDPKEKLLSKLGISSAHSFSLESTSHTAEDWRQSVAQDLRQHLVLGLIQRMCPSLDPTSLLDMQIMSLVQHARKVERDTYEMATNLEEYYDLLADKIYDTQKDLEEKQKGRKQQRNDVLVQKMRVLRQELHALQPQSDYCCIEISRDEVFEGSYRYIMMIKPEDLRKRLMVMFEGEEGVDYGGIAREWLYLLSHEIHNPSYGLFQYSHDDIYTLQINPDSGVNPEHLSYFHFVGRIIGIAIFHGHYLDGGFTMPFYKQLLGKRITLDDLESVDPVLHRSLVWILDNDITGIIDHSFCVDHEAYGERIMHDLKPDGKDIPVTEENKKEYVKLYVNWRFMRDIETQFLALQKGFSELIPQHLLQPFDERELELVISGLGKIDVEDWKKNTCLEECTADSNIVKWFWQAVEEFDEERRARLLQFVTGNSRVPLQGFKALQGSTQSQETGLFTIHQVDTDTDSLPNAHTCFNLIEIPPYESYEKFLDKLTCAIEETCGFTFE